jgi:hypothetical protein
MYKTKEYKLHITEANKGNKAVITKIMKQLGVLNIPKLTIY